MHIILLKSSPLPPAKKRSENITGSKNLASFETNSSRPKQFCPKEQWPTSLQQQEIQQQIYGCCKFSAGADSGGVRSEAWDRVSMITPVKKYGRARLSTGL